MCGIAGVMMKRGLPLDPTVLDRLQAALGHRGPDSTGRHIAPGLGLVSTRLSIVDLAGGDQPLSGPAGQVLIANAEMYNSPELRAAFPDYPFLTRSDCEPAFPLFAAHGEGFAQGLRGMYAVALHEPASGRLLLARDPFGIKPLYLAETADWFAFASEPQAILQAGLVPAALDPGKVAELLQAKFNSGEATIFPGIRRVRAGETLVLEAGEVVRRHHRSPFAPAAPARIGRDAALAAFERVIFDTVEAHLRMDTGWRLYFSGGIDSSILLNVARRLGPVRALTIGYAGAEAVDESHEAMRQAERIGAECQRVEMSAEDFWTLAPRVAAALDDPCTDPAVLPTYMLAMATRAAGAKVGVSGEGADEMFAGYARYRRALLPKLLRRRGLRGGVFDHSGLPAGTFGDWEAGIDAILARETGLRRNRLGVLQAIDVLEWLPNNLLIKLDRCLMANGVEGRTPFLDPKVMDFAARLPDRDKVSLRFGKTLLRDWLAKADPAARPYARKRGFNLPVGGWIGRFQAELARLVAAQPGVAARFAPDAVGRIIADAGRDAQPAWTLVFLALWHSHHILGIAAAGDIGAVLAEAAHAA